MDVALSDIVKIDEYIVYCRPIYLAYSLLLIVTLSGRPGETLKMTREK